MIGGSNATGSHDFLMGVKAVTGGTAASWSGNFWAAGLRTDSAEAPPDLSYSGAVNANGAKGLTWTKRLKALGATGVSWDGRPPDADYVILADPEGNRFCVVDITR